jgi:signal peptidase I
MSADATAASVPLWRRLLIGANPRRTAVRALCLAAGLLLLSRVWLPMRVSGVSMEPSVRHGSFKVVNRLAYWRNGPERGDIVAIRRAGVRYLLLKRIIALPGERVVVVNGVVRINGTPLDEHYVEGGSDWQVKELELAPGEYLVIGDNRTMSQQEHEYGKATRSQFVGKVVF